MKQEVLENNLYDSFPEWDTIYLQINYVPSDIAELECVTYETPDINVFSSLNVKNIELAMK